MRVNSGVPAIKKEKAYLRIVDVIIRLIAEGKVEYQDRFYTEQELMTMLGVSRPTLREALRVLEFLGVTTVSPRNGISIRKPSDQEGYLPLLYILAFEKTTGKELFELRQALQLEMTVLAAQSRTEEDLRDLQELLAEMERQLDADADVFYALDYRFHQRIVEAADNHLVLKLMNTIGPMLQNQLLRHGRRDTTKQRRATLEEHRCIVENIAAGSRAEARDAMERHLADSRRDAWLEGSFPITF